MAKHSCMPTYLGYRMEREARLQHFDFVKGYSNTKRMCSTKQNFVYSSGSTGGKRSYGKLFIFPDRERSVPSLKVRHSVIDIHIHTYGTYRLSIQLLSIRLELVL